MKRFFGTKKMRYVSRPTTTTTKRHRCGSRRGCVIRQRHIQNQDGSMFTRYIVGFAIYCALVLPLSFGQDAGGKSFGNATPVNGESVDQQFRKLTEEVVAAEVSGDLAAMDRFFADNYIHTHSSG